MYVRWLETVTTKGNYSPTDLSRTLLLQPRDWASKTISSLHCCFPSCTCKFTQTRQTWALCLQWQSSLCTQINLLLVPYPEMLLIHIITFLIAAEAPAQGDKSTLWPICMPQHESFMTLSPWYDCSCPRPICQPALFPATCCASPEITESISAHDNASKASSHISPHLLFVNDTTTGLETWAASVKKQEIPLGDLH